MCIFVKIVNTDMPELPVSSEIQYINISWIPEGIDLAILREDKIHDVVSGNKYRKLKYNLLEAQKSGFHKLLTFGGAHSNHIAAAAATCKAKNLLSTGLIRGEEWRDKVGESPTLSFARECGMKLYFLSREDYRRKEDSEFIQKLEADHGPFYLLPEGGSNRPGVRGCKEILNQDHEIFDYICVSAGTGGTLAGILHSLGEDQTLIGFSALKGTFQQKLIGRYSNNLNYQLTDEYCLGGYGKIDPELVRFMNEFKQQTGILLDPVYTGKMMYGIADMLKKGSFRKNSRILAIHTGGTQGIIGMNQRLKKKKLPQIEL